ncbi:MAG: 23S rRNA (adenine(2503)-C(2))-methyltransferase RlmN [Simkaniaceae bacterium]|nr:23S rRNA (adenine(2503)-C(2))-methyltransferase RlmN [Simkaniaceae bacterium]
MIHSKLTLLEEAPIKPLLYPLSLSFNEWKEWCARIQAPSFVANQIISWIYQKEILSPHEMMNLSAAVRRQLLEDFCWDLFAIEAHLKSKDGSHKLLLKTSDSHLIEMVIMPYENRSTLCLSSQVGCKMGCTFCQTGKMGLKRHLTSGEILGQIFLANRLLQQAGSDQKISNVVFMGMGEPLDNYDHVVSACSRMIDPHGLNLSKNRVTISTSGLIPALERLSQDLPVRLAISLHSADEEKRSAMMPVNRKYPLSELKKTLLNYPAPSRYGITFEYVMIENENDSIADAKKLVKFLHGIKAKVNLIPINHFPGIEMHPSGSERLRAFQKHLADRSIPAPIRYSRGQDVSGGCGQLAAKAEHELNMDPRILHKERRRLMNHPKN